jgi:hypothetical protein
MINIINSLADYIDTLDLYSPLTIDSFKGDLEEIIIRHEPSSAKVVPYMDGSREGEFNFSIHAKSQDGAKSVDLLSRLITDLDIKDDLQLTDLIKIKIEPVTAVRFITKTDNLEYIYASDYKLTYIENRR